MVTRRALVLAAASALALASVVRPAWAQAGGGSAEQATQFVRTFGDQLTQIVNGPGGAAEKKQQMVPLIDRGVAVSEIADFVLGQYNRTATPEQRQRFDQLFHEVLVVNVTSKLGEFRGVTYTMTQTATRGSDYYVGTLIKRPNQEANTVQWVVNFDSGKPQIVDVIAEGTSLKVTQRADYRSFLSRNNNNVDALIGAMQRQVGAS